MCALAAYQLPRLLKEDGAAPLDHRGRGEERLARRQLGLVAQEQEGLQQLERRTPEDGELSHAGSGKWSMAGTNREDVGVGAPVSGSPGHRDCEIVGCDCGSDCVGSP